MKSHGSCLSSAANTIFAGLGILIPSSHDTAPLENGMLIFVRFSFPSSYRNLNIITKRGVLCSFILYVFTATYRPPIILAVISRMPFLVCNDKPLPHRLSSLLVPVEFGTMTLYIFFLSTVFSMLMLPSSLHQLNTLFLPTHCKYLWFVRTFDARSED